jgi:FkbM family methyltransferase
MGMVVSKPVIVMALYDIGRDNWNSFNLSYDTYLWWMKNTLSIDANIVIYTEEKFASKIRDYRKEFDPDSQKTKMVISPVEELDCYKLYYDRLNDLMMSSNFKKKIHLEVPEMNRPLYNIIMFNKLHFLQHAKNENYFENDLLIWADAGGLRESIDNYKGAKWPSLDKVNQLDNSKITFFSHSKNIIVKDKEYHALSQIRFIQGTAFFVPSELIDGLVDDFNETVNECIDSGFIGSDEKIFDITYCKNREKYNLIKCDWRTYFKIFKDDGVKLFDKNGEQAKSIFIDLGGHEGQGLSSLIDVLDIDNSWEVYAFEPNSLIEDFSSDFPNHVVNFSRKAAWKRNGRAIFNRYGSDGRSQGSLLEETDGGRGYGDYFDYEVVPCLDFWEFVKSLDASKEIYIKMDIEWSEYDVVSRMLEMGWPKNIKKIWLQWHGTNDSKIAAKAEELQKRIIAEGTQVEKWR